MEALYKRNTLIKSISLMALMAAINCIFALLTNFVPFLGVVLVIFLPLTSALVEVLCKDRYFPIYAFATIGLSIVVSLSAFDVTVFYVIPSIITGYIFGLMSKKQLPLFLCIFVSSLLQTAVSFAFIPLIKILTQRDLINDLQTLLQIDNKLLFNNFLILGFFIISLMQTILSFIVTNNELKKLKLNIELKEKDIFWCSLLAFVSSILLLGFSFINASISYFCLGFAWFFAIFLIIYQFKFKQKISLIFTAVFLVLNIFFFAALNQYIKNGSEFLLFSFAPFLISLLSFIFSLLNKKKD